MDALIRPASVTLLGVPVRVSRGWLVIALVLAAISLDAMRPEGVSWSWYVIAVVGAIGATASVLLHEIAHVVAARRVGGRVLAIEPAMFGALSDDAYIPTTPRAEAWVAASGPLASLVLTATFAAAWKWATPEASHASGMVGFLALFNLAIAVSNAMPGFPLDGGRVFRAFVWYLTDDLITGTKIAAAYGQSIAIVGFVLGAVLLAVGDVISVWGAWGLIALFAINRAGREGFIRTVWRETSRGLTIDDVGLGNSRRIDANRSIDDAIDDILQSIPDGPVLVRDGDEILGIVTLGQIRRIPRAIWPDWQVRDAAVPIDSAPRIQYDSQLVDLATLFEQTGAEIVVVETRGKITGALERETAIRVARARVRAIRMEQRAKKRRGG